MCPSNSLVHLCRWLRAKVVGVPDRMYFRHFSLIKCVCPQHEVYLGDLGYVLNGSKLEELKFVKVSLNLINLIH